jgi:putative DNA primase/helicase
VFLAQDRLRSAGAATPHLVDLQGKRLVWDSETKEGDRLNIAQIKLLTGGGEISARRLHGHQYTFLPTHKLLLMTNYKPHADARDKAFWSRACVSSIPHSLQTNASPISLSGTP